MFRTVHDWLFKLGHEQSVAPFRKSAGGGQLLGFFHHDESELGDCLVSLGPTGVDYGAITDRSQVIRYLRRASN